MNPILNLKYKNHNDGAINFKENAAKKKQKPPHFAWILLPSIWSVCMKTEVMEQDKLKD